MQTEIVCRGLVMEGLGMLRRECGVQVDIQKVYNSSERFLCLRVITPKILFRRVIIPKDLLLSRRKIIPKGFFYPEGLLCRNSK